MYYSTEYNNCDEEFSMIICPRCKGEETDPDVEKHNPGIGLPCLFCEGEGVIFIDEYHKKLNNFNFNNSNDDNIILDY